MEYAKDMLFEVRYDTKLDKLVLKKERFRSKIFKKLKKHKLITTIVSTFLIFSLINITMIYSFFEILQIL